MAKGKHAAALFEVIHSAKDRQSRSGVLRTPKWWFKNRPQASEPGTPAIDSPPAIEVPKQNSTPPAPSKSLIRVNSQSLSDRITLRITYANVAIATCALVVIVSLAFVIGRRLSGGPARASAGGIEQLRQGRPNPDVLRVEPGGPAGGASKIAPASKEVDAFGNGPAPANASAGGAAPQGPQAPAASARRIVNMQYVVIQSYPKESDAKAAVDLLAKSGVPCTIEKGLRGFRADWFTVVGSTGFARTKNNADYTRYVETIAKVSDEFAGKNRFKQFDPMAYTWTEGK